MPIAADPRDLVQISLAQPPSYDIKYGIARETLENIVLKFSRLFDSSIFKELDRIFANSEATFIYQRCSGHLAKLAYSIFFIRKKLFREMAHSNFKDHFDIRIFPSLLYFTFGSKPVLSILTHAHLKNKYEILDEEPILFILRKLIPEIELVKDSLYAFQPPKNKVKTIYFEISKKSGNAFTFEEIKQLQNLLKQEIKFSIEQVVPRIFMIRNEEEVLKNILTLSREIQFISDLPQVMILFDQQTSQEVFFTIILVKVLKPEQSTIQQGFASTPPNIEYLPDRCQIVRYLRKKYPVEANVFRFKLIKDSTLLRVDKSLNFYLARQKISQILIDKVGEFRDYNGGIILKQREVLAALQENFSGISLKDADLLENFYYSLSPIEAQTTISHSVLKTLFEVFLEAQKVNFTQPYNSFLKFQRNGQYLCILVRIPDENFKEDFKAISYPFELAITFNIHSQNTHLLGYLLTDIDQEKEEQLFQSLTQALETWKQSIQSRQILKLSFEHPILSLDPRIGGDQISAIILKMLFEGLMRINREGNLENGIAQHVEISEDRKTYLFHFRQTNWSNGSLVSAYDFEYTWKNALSPTFQSPFAYLFYPIKNAKLAKSGATSLDNLGIKALDQLTLKIDLEFPSPYFLELTAHPIYSPVNRLIDEQHPNWPFEDKGGYVCNGAFILRKNNVNESYELSKNPLYWDKDNIYLDEIRLLKANPHQAYELFLKGLNDWIASPLGTYDPNFIISDSDERISYKDSVIYWLVFNTEIFPFNSKKLRKALSLGIDRSKIKELFNISPAISPVPPLNSQISHSILSTPQIEEAKTLFQEALEELGLSLENFPVIPLIYLAGPIRNQVIQYIKDAWTTVFGIRCSLEPVAWKTLLYKFMKGDYLIGGITWEPWINDAIYTLNAFRDKSEAINFPKWENTQYQQIMHSAEKEIDIATRQDYYLQAEKILLEEMPVAPIFLVEAPGFKKKKFQIYRYSPGMNFKWGYFN